ncbi:retrotransposon protein, putative, ty1-copia subclass [Tanacetum coccineum]
MTKLPFTRSCERGEGLLDLVHTDVCGPFRSATKDGKRYYVTFTDDFCRYGYVYLIKHKSNTFEVFKRREAQDKLESRSEKCLFVDYPEESFGYLFYKPKDNVVFVARRRVFLKIEMISKKDSESKIDLEEIQESVDEEPIVNTNTQQEVVTPIEPDDISLPIRRTISRVSSSKEDRTWNGKMDVKTAFLNEKLTEDVFMAQPEGFKNTKYPKRVCKLQKAIYELKQASRRWNLCFHEKVTQFGFSRREDESCIYVKVSGSVVVFLVFYVDDIILIGNDIPKLQSVKDWLGKCFAMKDIGDASYILGIKIYRDRSKRLIGLSQDMTTTLKRPNVSFALSMVSQHQQNPGEDSLPEYLVLTATSSSVHNYRK